jgi:putative nucleotidyltransferase with HDIG domain
MYILFKGIVAYRFINKEVFMRLMPVLKASELHLAEDVYDVKGSILVKRNTKLKDNLCYRILQNGIHSVYIKDQYSTEDIEPLIATTLKIEMTHKLRELFTIIASKQNSQSNVKTSMKLIDQLLALLTEVDYELTRRTKPYIDFIDIKSTETYTYEHSIDVAILSYLLAKRSGLGGADMKNLLIGALFHDIGMAFIDESIFMKNGKLDMSEFVRIKEHPQLGYNFIKNQVFANAYIKVIALQHHERLDGSGYPNAVSGEEIHRLTRYVSITDVYDAMVSDRPYSRAVNASTAIEYLMGLAVDKLDYQLTKTFCDTIIPYPIGTVVSLSDGRLASIPRINFNIPTRPEVQIIDLSKKALTSEIIDLSKAYNLSIDKVIHIVDE